MHKWKTGAEQRLSTTGEKEYYVTHDVRKTLETENYSKTLKRVLLLTTEIESATIKAFM